MLYSSPDALSIVLQQYDLHNKLVARRHLMRTYQPSTISTHAAFRPALSIARFTLGSSRLDTTRLATRSTCRAHAFCLCRACRTARPDTLDTTIDWLDTQLVCCIIRIKLICKLFTNLLEYTFTYFISFNGTNRICVCKTIKMTKLVRASTIACSSSAMLEQHGSKCSKRSSRLATTSNVLSRVET